MVLLPLYKPWWAHKIGSEFGSVNGVLKFVRSGLDYIMLCEKLYVKKIKLQKSKSETLGLTIHSEGMPSVVLEASH